MRKTASGWSSWRKVVLPAAWLLMIVLVAVGWNERETLFPRWFPRILHGHTDLVSCVAISPDGRYIASGSGDYFGGRGEVRVWDEKTGRQLFLWQGFPAEVWSLAFSPDSGTLATGTAYHEGGVKLWDVQTGQLRQTLSVGNPKGWRGIKFDKSGEGDHWINALAFSPDGKTLAALDSGELTLWDVATGRASWRRVDRKPDETNVAFSPDGRTLISAARSATVLHRVPSPDATWGFTTETGGQAQLLDARTGRVLRDYPVDPNAPTQCMAFSPDGKALAIINVIYTHDAQASGSALEVVDVQTGRALWKQTLNGDFANVVLYSPDGRSIVTENNGETVVCWDALTGNRLSTRALHIDMAPASASVMGFSHDGRLFVHREGKDVKVWRASVLRQ